MNRLSFLLACIFIFLVQLKSVANIAGNDDHGSPRDFPRVWLHTGAVARTETSKPIRLYSPPQTELVGSVFALRWESEVKGSFTLTVNDIFDHVLLEKEVQGTSAFVDLHDPGLTEESLLLVHIELKSNPEIASDEVGIKRLSPDEVNKKVPQGYLTTIASSADELIRRAQLYEQESLLLDAITHYELAMLFEPDNEDLKEIYQAFLSRNGLIE